MNIVLIHYSAPPIVGGVETVLARQAQVLARAGHRVRILAGRGETWDAQIPVVKLSLIDSRHPLILKARSSLDQGIVPPGFSTLVEKIEAELFRLLRDIDIVILHNVASVHRNLPLTQALFNISQSGKPGLPGFILWHHDLSCASPRTQNLMYPGLPWDLLRQNWPGVKQVTVSRERQHQLSAVTGLATSSIEVIAAGLTLSDFLGLNRQTLTLVEDLKLAVAAPLLLTPVRVARRKNLEQAINCLAILRQTFPDAALVVTGPDRGVNQSSNQGYLKSLKHLRAELGLEHAVHLLAEIYPDGLPPDSFAGLYRLADALLLTSREEGFGMPVLEAGLTRLPVFCTDLPSLRELAAEDAVYFSPADPPEKVANLIASRLESDPVYRMRMRVRHDFTWDAVYTRQIQPLLESLSSR